MNTFNKISAVTFAAMLTLVCSAMAQETETPVTESLTAEVMTGGYEINEGDILSEEAVAIFTKAAETSQETEFTPVAVLSTQLVAGTNYRFLATKEGEAYYVTVYADLDGNAEITQTEPVTISDEQLSMITDLCGQYQDRVSQRASLYLEADTEDRYNITIDWGNSASSTYEWTMTCIYVPEVAKFFAENNVTLTDLNTEGNQELYKDGKAAIAVWQDEDEKVTLRWNDAQESAGSSCIFEKVQ